MDSLDQYIQGVVTKEIYEPENYIKTIQNSLDTNDRHRKYFNLYKVAIIVICLLCTSGIAYATYNYVKNNFNRRKGIETAINNGYIMNVDGEPVTSNDVSLKINQILLDDYNLDISFDLEFKNMEIPDNVQLIKFENILIADENNNILYHSGNRDIFDKFVKANNLDLEYKDYNEKYINASSSNKFNFQDKNSVNIIYSIANEDYMFPTSKILHVYIDTISLCTFDNNYNLTFNLEVHQLLSSVFLDRKSINYVAQGTYDSNIKSLDITTYTTGTTINMEIITPAGENDSSQLKSLRKQVEEERSSENYYPSEIYNGISVSKSLKEYYIAEDLFSNPIRDVYLEDRSGNKFYTTQNNNIDNIVLRPTNEDKIIYSTTIDMTIFDCQNELSLHFIYNNHTYCINIVQSTN